MTVGAAAPLVPAIFTHCRSVYQAMFERARPVDVEDPRNPGEKRQRLIYVGHLTKLITSDLNLSSPYYTSCLRELKRMGCIRQLRRGGSTTESEWLLIREPTLELFMHERPKKATTLTTAQMFEAHIIQLQSRVQKLEEGYDKLALWIYEHDLPKRPHP